MDDMARPYYYTLSLLSSWLLSRHLFCLKHAHYVLGLTSGAVMPLGEELPMPWRRFVLLGIVHGRGWSRRERREEDTN